MSKKNGKLRKRLIVGALAVIALGGAGYAALNSMQAEEVAATPTVRTMPLGKTTITDAISVSGVIYSADTKNIYSSQDFPIKEVYVEIGDKVKAGDILAEFDMSSVGYELRQTENSILNAEITASEDSKSIQSSITNAEISLETSQINLEKQQFSYDTLKEEYENGTSTSLVSAKNAMDSAATNLESAQNDVATRQRDYETNAVLFESGVLSKNELDTYEQSLDAAEDALKTARINYDQAVESYEKTKLTLAQELERSAQDLESAKISHKSAQNALTQARAKTSSAEISIDNQKINMEKLQEQLGEDKIIATIDGTVTAVNVTVGEKPEVKSLFVIEDTDNLYVAANVMEYDLADVTTGLKANITTDATDDQIFTGEISYISPKAVSEAGSTTVEFETHADIIEKSPLLRIGMNAFLDIITESREDVYAVPYTAVVTTRGESVIYVLENNTVTAVPVSLGLETSTYAEISGDRLTDGMRVIMNPTAVTVGQTVDAETGGAFMRDGQGQGQGPDGEQSEGAQGRTRDGNQAGESEGVPGGMPEGGPGGMPGGPGGMGGGGQ